MKYRQNSSHIPVHVDMTPMVDVMMLLLIFFMMSTTFIVAHPGFNIVPPQANSGTPQPPEHITVLVNRDGNIALENGRYRSGNWQPRWPPSPTPRP